MHKINNSDADSLNHELEDAAASEGDCDKEP